MKRLVALCTLLLLPLMSCSRNTPEEMFYQALGNWNVSDIRDEVVDGADVNMRFKEHGNMTPLMVAAQAHHPECVRYLLQAGADVDAVDDNGYTALDYAERSRSMKGREILLAAGAKPTRRKGLVQKHATGPCPPEWKIKDSPLEKRLESCTLHQACQWGDFQAVEHYLRNGADVDARDYNGRTPLMYAAGSFADTDCSEWITARLLAAGADPNATDNTPRNVLNYATEDDHAPSDLVPMLLEAGATVEGWTDPDFYSRPLGTRAGSEVDNLHLACEAGDLEAVQRFLAAGADVNATEGGNHDGWTPLMEAVGYQSRMLDREKIVALLLAAGADVNMVNGEGENALFLAVESGYKHNGIVPMLLAAGADASIVTNYKSNILDALPHFLSPSAEKERAGRVKALLQQHGAPEDKTPTGFMNSDRNRKERGLRQYSLQEGGHPSLIHHLHILPHV